MPGFFFCVVCPQVCTSSAWENKRNTPGQLPNKSHSRMARGKQKNLPSHDHCFRLPLLFSWPKFCFIRFFFLEISNHHHHPFLFVAVAAYHVSTFSSCLQFCGRYCTLIQLMIAGDYTAQPSRPHLVSVSLLPEKPTKWNRIKRNRARSRNNSRVNQPISLQGGGKGEGRTTHTNKQPARVNTTFSN